MFRRKLAVSPQGEKSAFSTLMPHI
jgi:hypothetical protein